MSKIKYRFGDKYEIVKNSISKFNTNYIALIVILLIISSFSFQLFYENNISEKFILGLIYHIIWIVSFTLLLVIITIKLIKHNEVDLYLITIMLLIIISYMFLAFN